MPSRTKMGKVRGEKKGIEGRQGTAWVVPGPFRGRRTRALILSGLLGCVVTGESRTRILGPSPKEGESSREAALQEMGQRRISDYLDGQDAHCYRQGNTSGAA